MNIFNIPNGNAFLPALVEGLAERYGRDNPLGLSNVTILLPTRRACGALRDQFLKSNLDSNRGGALLLPRIAPIGDWDPAEHSLLDDSDVSIPPAIQPLRRHLLLSQLIRNKSGDTMAPDHALHMAFALAELIDEVATAQISWDDFAGLVPELYADHWNVTLDFLRVVTDEWPQILQRENLLDPAAHRNLALQKQIAIWQAQPPDYPVIAAGVTGAIPVVAEAMAAIAALPQGFVILRGLDQKLDNEAWQDLHSSHPQFGMKNWLDSCRVSRDAVQLWHGTDDKPLAALWRTALHPDPASWGGSGADKAQNYDVNNLAVIEGESAQEEAEIIALKTREALQDPKRTVMIVTPDPNLNARIKAALRRYDITVNDSSGTRLTETAIGNFLDLLLALPEQEFAAVPFLAFLKHPLCGLGFALPFVRQTAREFELSVLRGPAQLGGLAAYIAKSDDTTLLLDAVKENFTGWCADFKDNVTRPFKEFLEKHVQLAEAAAATDSDIGALRLWQGDDGDAAAQLFRHLMEMAECDMQVTASDYAALIRNFIERQVARPRFGTHPRVRLLTPVESRLQHADVVILSGLNEGVWPMQAEPGPWLSRPMRKQLGLMTPEQQIGLSAHDFAQCAAQSHVILTRAVKASGAPTIRARWLERLYILLHATNQWRDVERSDCWRDWLQQLERPEQIRNAVQPRPMPPVAVRPRSFSVSEIELWRRDPYALYAKRILKLRKLPELGEDPDARNFGSVVHKILEIFFATPDLLSLGGPYEWRDTLQQLALKYFDAVLRASPFFPFWQKKFEALAVWVADRVQVMQQSGDSVFATEQTGYWRFNNDAGAVAIHGRADLILQQANGALLVVDYKTGTPPKKIEQTLGYAPQLPLLSLIADKNGFGNDANHAVAGALYWDFKQSNPKTVEFDLGTFQLQLQEWIASFDKPDMAYIATPHPDFAARYNDYSHLSRLKEWALASDD